MRRPDRTAFLRFLAILALFLSIDGLLPAQGLSEPASTRESDWVLWYRQPAQEWVEALPVGNGRLGAMIFGGVSRERIQLNEDTIWSGGRPRPAPPGAFRWLPEIRRLLFNGRYSEAEDLVRDKLLTGYGEATSYQTLGDLLLDTVLQGEPQRYRRSLDLDSGIAATSFEIGGVTHRREVFSSAPDQVIVVHLSAD
ncbi:MAG: glycoside hydrolase family 95 protein, partial [Acidobacteriota bacterium]